MQFLKHTESPACQQSSRCLAKKQFHHHHFLTPPPSPNSPWPLTPSLPPPPPPLITPPSLQRPHYTQILTLSLFSAFPYNLSFTSLYTIICSFSLFFLYPPLPGRSSQSSVFSCRAIRGVPCLPAIFCCNSIPIAASAFHPGLRVK